MEREVLEDTTILPGMDVTASHKDEGYRNPTMKKRLMVQ